MARAKKAVTKKPPFKGKPDLKGVPADSLPQSANIPEGMKQMGGGYAPTWSPETVGDSLHGVVSTLPKELTLNKGKRSEIETRVMEVTDMEGDRHAVWESVLLTELFDEVVLQGPGTEIFIEYNGLGKKKAGQNAAKLFTVAIAE